MGVGQSMGCLRGGSSMRVAHLLDVAHDLVLGGPLLGGVRVAVALAGVRDVGVDAPGEHDIPPAGRLLLRHATGA